MYRLMLRVCGVILMAGAVGLSAGCGGKTEGTVTGKVTLDNKPLAMGSVIFQSADQESYIGKIQSDGTYTVKGVPYGPVKIAVLSQNPAPRLVVQKDMPDNMKKLFEKKKLAEPPGVQEGDPEKWFPIPVEYTQVDSSKLELTVNKKDTKFDIDMKAPPPAPE